MSFHGIFSKSKHQFKILHLNTLHLCSLLFARSYYQECPLRIINTHTPSPHLEKHNFYYVADFLDFLGIIFKKELIRELSLTLAIC